MYLDLYMQQLSVLSMVKGREKVEAGNEVEAFERSLWKVPLKKKKEKLSCLSPQSVHCGLFKGPFEHKSPQKLLWPFQAWRVCDFSLHDWQWGYAV